MTDLTSQEVAERIGVSMSTLKNWAVRLPVPSTLGPDGSRVFPPEALAVLEAVKHLREEERSYATIRRTINPAEGEPPATAPGDGSGVANASPAVAEVVAPVGAPPEALESMDSMQLAVPAIAALVEPNPTALADPGGPDLAVVMARVLEVLNEQSALSESYASARQRVGELEMALRLAHDDRVRLQAELADHKRLLERELERTARRRPWWVRFFDLG